VSTPPDEVAANVREILELARNGNSLTQKPEALIDPTKNVLDKIIDAVKRLDDLATLRASYEEKLALKETERINAVNQAERERINAVIADIRNSVVIASKEAAATAGTLATQVATTAEALRSRSETRGQSNFNLSQWITVGGIVVLVAVELHRSGVI
jgi:hypothetical protein